jgi:glycosyltransferase involved in cell wall biosynthesis
MNRLSLAFVTPLNPIPNGLSDYSEMLLPALAEYADITIYSECGTPANVQIADRFEVRPVRQLLRRHAEHDLRLYQIGNSADHASAFEMLRCLPGIVVLHEPFLHTGYRYMSTLRPYQRELLYELGALGPEAQSRWAAEADRRVLQAAPLIRRLIDSSLGVIVHSQIARRLIWQTSSPRAHAVPIEVIPHLMALPVPIEPQLARSEFGWPVDALLIGVPGTIDPTKEPALTLRAFAELSQHRPEARLIFMGDQPLDYGLSDLVRELNLGERVEFMGRVEPLAKLERAMATCDIIINLRRPTIGETSGTALRALALGRALVVRDIGWFSEIPAECSLKIDATAEVEELAQVLLTLASQPELRQRLGDAARAHLQAECQVTQVARCYEAFFCRLFTRGFTTHESRFRASAAL